VVNGADLTQLHRTPSQIEVERVGFQLGAEPARPSAGPSSSGWVGVIVRRLLSRATRSLAVREAVLDHGLVASAEALAFDTAIGQRAASSFPQQLVPSSVTDIATEVGRLYMHAGDRVMTPLIRETGQWEPGETAFLRRTLKEGHTFVDVGANVGYFSVLASALVGPMGRVVAVEPEQRNLALLKANLWRNRCGNAIVLPIAAHRETGFLPLRPDEKNRGNHQVGRTRGASALVPCARLDDLLASLRIDAIKVDTQGTDHDVIAGLSALVRPSTRTTIMCEFWIDGMEQRGLDPSEVAGEYKQLGFELALLTDTGEEHRASPAEIVAAARDSGVKYVNVVLRNRR
jgi:FkbM family methyltransferase